MSEKVFKEFCEDCGCPLEVCCKPKTSGISIKWLETEIKRLKKAPKKKNRNMAEDGFILGLNILMLEARKQAKVAKK